MSAHVNRRQLVLALAAAGLAPGARAVETTAQAFDANTAANPWLTPFKGVGEATQDLQNDALTLSGKWPANLRGRFYRNGPALFERGGVRYQHWFDGDGMVQQFSIGGGRVAHRGRMVRTPKLLAEQQAGHFLYSVYGTQVPAGAQPRGPDSFNAANTNAIEHAGRVLAMWEGGSATAMDPKDLATVGPVTWKAGLEQMPFSAHPKVDASGHLWNIGAAGNKLVVWHIDPRGALVQAQVVDSPYPGGMVHDMSVTAQYVVVPLPPVKMHFGRGDPASCSEFQPNEPLRVLVLRKDDLSQRRIFELPAQMMFHIGNTFERGDGSIVMSYAGAADASFLSHGAVSLLRGQPNRGADPGTCVAMLDMRSGRAQVQLLGDIAEFPRVHPRLVGQRANFLLSTATWLRHSGRDIGLFHGVQLVDMTSGKADRYDYGVDHVVEEHILVPRPGSTRERDAWLLGTTFDAKRQITMLHLLDAQRVAAGPIAQAALPYKLPLGFHGNFTAA